jgi:uncharacterized repeat protein (TIGR03803 family)
VLLQATDGNLYGTTEDGGTKNAGTLFKITPSGALATFYNFCPLGPPCSSGDPQTGVIQATDGNFYGTVDESVFQITPSGTLTTLHTFSGSTHGKFPEAGLVQATNGDFYGTTLAGGTIEDSCRGGCGVVFKITSGGTLTELHKFDGTDGQYPYGALIQATNNDLFGTTSAGGAAYGGTAFMITPSGTLTTVHSFCLQSCTDGATPYSGLVQVVDGDLYGTTTSGGGLFQFRSMSSGVWHGIQDDHWLTW